MQFKDLEKVLKGRLFQMHRPNQQIRNLLTDSRRSFLGKEALFFAIPGPNHDGHNYLHEVYDKGCGQFIVEKPPDADFPQANIFIVNNAVEALQEIAAEHRRHFNLPVVGLSGSNGKTIVKEWLSQLISRKKVVVKSPKSYNSQIGVPLSVWHLNAQHEMGIFEAGISLPSEMHHLQTVIKPNLGIFTNIGPAHDSGFTSQASKIAEKSILFRDCRTIIYRKDYEEIHQHLTSVFEQEKLISWSTADKSSSYYFEMSEDRRQVIFKGHPFPVPFQDEASVENLLHCIVFLLENG